MTATDRTAMGNSNLLPGKFRKRLRQTILSGSSTYPRSTRGFLMGGLGYSRCDVSGEPATAGNGTMIVLSASSWNQVDAFHAAAVTRGGTSERAPGLRPIIDRISTRLSYGIQMATGWQLYAAGGLRVITEAPGIEAPGSTR